MSKNKNKKSNIVNNGLETALIPQNNSVIAGIGTMYTNSNPHLLSNDWVMLTNTYKSNAFAKMAVDLPIQDCFKDYGFEIDSTTLNTDELLELKETMIDEGDFEVLKDVCRWSRLYGGGVVIALTEQKPEAPFNPETIHNKKVKFIACDRWQCYPESSNAIMADKFVVQDLALNQNIAIYDKSRLKTFTGDNQPYYIRNQLQGWGASIYESIIPSLSQYIKANNVILELLDEAKIDILKIFGLSDLLMSEQGDSAVRRRVKIFAEQKNFQSVGVMDGQDDYVQKQLTFGSLDRILEKIFLMICSNLRLPYSKVFGKGANGLGTGADLDIQNYHMMIESTVRIPITPIAKWMIDTRCYQLFGRKADINLKWKSLEVLSELEKNQADTQKINSLIQLAQIGVLNKKQVAEKLTNEGIINLSEEEINKLEETENEEELEEQLRQQDEERKQANNSIIDKIKNKIWK